MFLFILSNYLVIQFLAPLGVYSCKSVDITRGGQLGNADTWGCHCLCGQVFSYGKCEGWSCPVQPPSMHHIYIGSLYVCLYGVEPLKCAIIQKYSIVFHLSLAVKLKSRHFINLLPLPLMLIPSIIFPQSVFSPQILWCQNFFLVSRTASSPWWVGLILCKLWQPQAKHITRFIYRCNTR